MTPRRTHSVRQRPLHGGRSPLTGALDPALRRWVRGQAEKFDCAESFVLNTLVSWASGIELVHDDYRTASRLHRKEKARD